MNINERKAAIRHLVSGARMDTFGDEITWFDHRPMPSDAEIVAAHKQVLLGGARTAAIERIETGYRQALKSFDHGGTTWDASDDSATVLRDLLNRLANGKGLPRGKTTVTLRDTAGTAHEMNAEAVKDLGAAGSDHRDECLETRLALIDQVRKAKSVEDAEKIRWPE